MKAIQTLALAAVFLTISSCATSQSKPSRKQPVSASDSGAVKQIPVCIRVMIEKYETEEKQNPPRKIYQYTYKGKPVYYVTPPCCDFFSELFDAECNLLGHPDGGITGKGDGSLPNFETEKKNETLVWEDMRK